jgi:hypothetical protein
VLDRTRPKAVAESRLHSSSVKVHGAPSPQWNPWQRGRREHPRAGNPRSLPIWRAEVKSNSAQDPHLGGEGRAEGPSDLAGGVSGALVNRLVGDDPGKDSLAATRALGHRSTHDHLVAHGPLVHGEGQGDQTVRAARRTKDQDAGMVPLPTPDCVTRCDAGRQVRRYPARLPAIAQRRLADRRESDLMARSRPLCSCAPRVAPASSSHSASPCISDAQALR